MKIIGFILALVLYGCTTAPTVAPTPPTGPAVVALPEMAQASCPPQVVCPPSAPCPICPVCPALPKPIVAGYYAGWTSGTFKPSSVDFSKLTQVQNFSVVPNSDGTLDASKNHLNPDLVAAAKSAGVKVLLTVGSSDTAVGFRGACKNIPAFVANILALAKDYDGVDLDWEPLETTDYPMFTSLVNTLRVAMPDKILAVAMGDYPDPVGKVALLKSLPQIDQINLMTYDLAGPWSGWVTYHDSALYSYGPAFIRSADSIVSRYLTAGIPASKISIGVAFYGFVWGGVSKPLDAWPSTAIPSYTSITYDQVLAQYPSATPIWDDKAQAIYISLNGKFITFENEQSIAAKIAYVRAKGLRGLTIWELSQGPSLMKAFK